MSPSGRNFFLAIHQARSVVAQIGEPVRRYTVIPLEEPVSPTHEPATPPPTSPDKAPVTKPEPEPVRRARVKIALPSISSTMAFVSEKSSRTELGE